jgi:hypothetical protein
MMVKKTFALSDQDKEKLVSYACRYRSISTVIDEKGGTMTVYTTFADNNQATSRADSFDLDIISNDPPKMPKDEYQRRVKGSPEF